MTAPGRAQGREPMVDEFDTLPQWTADAVREVGPGAAVPAGCRGSGSPEALRWLGRTMGLHDGVRLLDSGAGIGGPAELAARDLGARPVLADPMPGACRAAARLYGRPVVVADGGALPFPDATFDAAWCLGVLSTVPHQARVVGELRRVVRDGGAVGWLVFVRTGSLPEQPEGNHFPDQDGLAELLARAGLTVTAEAALADFPAADESWRHQADLVDRVVERDHGGDERLRSADEQAATMGRLLDDGLVVGRLLVTRAG